VVFLLYSTVLYCRIVFNTHTDEKKKTEKLSSLGPCVKLFLDDIEEVLQILATSCQTVSIQDKDFEYQSLDEVIQKRGKHPKTLHLIGYNPYVVLSISGFIRSVHLFANGEEPSMIPFAKIKSILERNKRGWVHGILGPAMITAYSITLIGWFLRLPISLALRITLVAILLILISVLGVSIEHGMLSILSLGNKSEKGSFWSRNRDSIWLALITAIVTALLTWFITYITFKQGIK
jgi:NADH:ubiquinone oxidoreductase subunit 5 (subunit L)/multisubunit Na+/H+ antiporter MnhA subunit